MNKEQQKMPVYLSLIEKRGERTERLIKEIKDKTILLNLYDEINLCKVISTVHTSPNENTLIYCLDLSTGLSSDQTKDVYAFLQYVFKKLFDNYPAFTEPPQPK